MSLSLSVVKGIQGGRASGRMNLSGQNLEHLPSQVYDPNEPLPPVKGKSGQEQDSAWWGWAEVKRLDVSRNRLTSLPDQLASLGTLTALDASYNQLQTLPDGLSGLFQLASLIVDKNALRALPPLPHSLVVLSTQHNQLTSVPPVARCTELVKLDLAHNMLQGALPGEALRGLGQSLKELDLSCNQLQALPQELGCLTQLRMLHVVHNRLTSLPESIGNCLSLVELHAGQNALQVIPPSLGACTSLRHLSLRDNRIREVPTEICNLQLYVLDLQSCDLSSLPPQLGLMTSLKSLLLEGNALRTIRRPLITGPTSNLLKFLASRIPESPGEGGAPTQAAQSGNVFGQDANALAADMAHKLAVANRAHGSADESSTYTNNAAHAPYSQGAYSAPFPQGPYGQGPSYQPQHPDAYAASSQHARHSQGPQHCSGYQNAHSGYYGGHSQHPGQPYGYSSPYGYGSPYGQYSAQGGGMGAPQPYSSYPYSHQPPQQAYYQGHSGHQPYSSSSGHAQSYQNYQGYQGYPQPGYHQQDSRPPLHHQQHRQHQLPPPPQPSKPNYKAAHSTAPFATEATPPLPAPKPSVSKPALPKSELLLSKMGLRDVPEEVWEASSALSKLDLSNNQIASLPLEGMAQCTQLRTLLLCRAGLQAWPLAPSPGCLAQLRELVLCFNRIQSIPPGAFAACPNLCSLDLSGVPGAATMAPGTLSSLSSLQSLDLSYTGLVHAPLDELAPMAHSLRTLNLSSNRINSLPAGVAGLTRLEELCLSNNDLGNLPPQLGLLNLRSLTLDGNPLRSIRRPIIEKGTAAVLQYLKERIPGS